MKKAALLVFVFCIAIQGFSQSLTHAGMGNGGMLLGSFSFTTDQQAIIKISPDGKVLEWGTEMEAGRYGYYQGKLLPYMGRVEYYGQDADEAYRGKVKSIGTAVITYFGTAYPPAQKGKIKSIGSLQLDYYMDYDNESLAGKLKTAGGVTVNYYSSFENESFRGKLKSIGNTTLTYYSVFDDKFNKGKIKTIGTYSYSWYNEFDKKELQGAMKTGATLQKINGITYTLWQ